MKSKIIDDKKNDLFKRRELIIEVEAEITPSKKDALKIVVEQTKAPEEQIVIKNVLGKFGVRKFTITSFIYNSKEDKESIEPKKKEKKQ